MAQIAEEAGVPAGVINVLTTSKTGAVVGAMLHDPRVRKLSFTGSTEVGRGAAEAGGGPVLNCSMELGGNAPFIVFEDADIEAALEGAMIAKMRNGGEACTAANRFYVHKDVAEASPRGSPSGWRRCRSGRATTRRRSCGPMINAEAIEKIGALVADAKQRGARVITGGEALERDGFYYPPTVIDGVPADAEITREEIFGPVAAITTFETEAEVIAAANATEYGLVAYVYTGDLARGLRVSEKLESGMVGLNRGLISDPAAPFGGVKQSGLGREGGHHGIMEFVETKYIAASW